MTDAAYCLRETERERKSLARMSRYKKNGSKTNYVRLPQTYMTESEWKKMNSSVETVALNKPMVKDDFLKLSESLRKEYLSNLADRYNPRMKDVAEMLGYTPSAFWAMCKTLYGDSRHPFHNKSMSVSLAWSDFINPPKEDIADIETPSDAPLDASCRVGTDKAPEKKPDVIPMPKPKAASMESITMMMSGTPADLLSAFAKALLMLDEGKKYHAKFITDELIPIEPALSNF